MSGSDDPISQQPRLKPPLAGSAASLALAPDASMPPVLDSEVLPRGHNAVAITHNGALYRL